MAGAFVDFGLYVHRNAEALLERGWGPYFYIPKLESHHEAALWHDAFVIAEETLGLERGTIKATVLIETIPAAFCMDAILYELRDHAAGLNAGRWDYIFSMIKRFRSRPEFVMPDRSEVTMTVPFMKAYSDLVVKTCHARGAHAMGGMAAVIPSRTDEEANRAAFEAVRSDKEREAKNGFDGTWVAHPDSVPVAMDAFDAVLGERPNQVDKQRDDVQPSASALLDVASAPGERTEEGLRSNVNVGIQYVSSWLRGNGAAAIYGLMEDAATAEIARGQVWQWIRHGATLDDGRTVTPELVRELEGSELEKIRAEIGDDEWFENEGRPELQPLALRARRAERGVHRVPDPAGVRGAAEAGALDVVVGDEPAVEGALRQADALLVLRKLLHTELLEQRAQVCLDRADAQVELVGDLLVRGGGGECVAALERAAERHEHAPLRIGQGGRRDDVLGHDRRERIAPVRSAEHDAGLSEAERVAVSQPVPVGEAGSVHERAVLGEAVVAEGPIVAQALELGVEAGDLGVPLERDVVRAPSPDGQPVGRGRQLDDVLPALAVPE